jgi:hypothetical protein
LFIHVHKFPIKHMCWHSITKIHRNGPRAHFPFTEAYRNPTDYSRLSEYTAMEHEVHGPDYDPRTKDIDGDVFMRVG